MREVQLDELLVKEVGQPDSEKKYENKNVLIICGYRWLIILVLKLPMPEHQVLMVVSDVVCLSSLAGG